MTRPHRPTASASGTPNTVLNTGVFDAHKIKYKKRILSDQQEYRRKTDVRVSKVPVYKNRTKGFMQSQVAHTQNTSSSAAIREGCTGITLKTKIEEKRKEN
ncbi:hypothetical protein ACJMK2_010655 [Sinanodonta woodiana]|uniref:Uncharacterized protein n=1 Tax=Sinanodonta woodiana TaxID=1069815 RepID=A0ABD3VG21_SINWO